MKRRWIIRSFFIGLLLLCVCGWGASVSHDHWFWYWHHGSHGEWHSDSGMVYMHLGWSKYNSDELAEIQTNPHAACFWPPSEPELHLFMGFGFDHANDADGSYHYSLFVPYWFLIVVLSAISFVVWRKTRPKVKGRAFPVESGAPAGKS